MSALALAPCSAARSSRAPTILRIQSIEACTTDPQRSIGRSVTFRLCGWIYFRAGQPQFRLTKDAVSVIRLRAMSRQLERLPGKLLGCDFLLIRCECGDRSTTSRSASKQEHGDCADVQKCDWFHSGVKVLCRTSKMSHDRSRHDACTRGAVEYPRH